MAQKLKLIRKKDEIKALNGTIIDNLDSNSTSDAPSIRAVNEKFDAVISEMAEADHTHEVADITDFPTIPTKTSELINDSGFLTEEQGIEVDSALDETSENPVQNKIVTVAIGEVSDDIELALQELLGVGTVEQLNEVLGV